LNSLSIRKIDVALVFVFFIVITVLLYVDDIARSVCNVEVAIDGLLFAVDD
jgi:hypothetical protein